MEQALTSLGAAGRFDRKHWITTRRVGTVGFQAVNCLEETRDGEGILSAQLGKPLGRLDGVEQTRPLQAHSALHVPIDPSSPISMFLFVASSDLAAFLVPLATTLSWAFIIFFLIYIRQEKANLELYQGTIAEWSMIIIVLGAVVLPAIHDALKPMDLVKQLVQFARKSQPEVRTRMYLATAVVAFDMFQPLVLLILSTVVALFLSDNDFMDAVLNVVVLQFVGNLDTVLIQKFVEFTFSGACLSLVLLDVNYSFPGVNYDAESAFWDSSNSSKKDVERTLRSASTSITQKWEALLSGSRGLGILGTWPESHHVQGCRGEPTVQSIVVQTEVLRWSDVSFQVSAQTKRC